MKTDRIAVAGGDARLGYLAGQLADLGFSVICFGTASVPGRESLPAAASFSEAAAHADIIIGGIPLFRGQTLFAPAAGFQIELPKFCRNLRKGQKLFGGLIPRLVREHCQAAEISYYDFMEDDSLAVFNAIATAEGCILTALREQPTNLHQSRCLILGYGRCGRVLAGKLRGLSASVTVYARGESARAYAQADGMDTLKPCSLPQEIGTYEYIFNTVPALLLTEDLLRRTAGDVIIIDLASGNGGVDYQAAEKLHIRALLCPGLPGLYAPKASANGLADFILKKLE